MTHSPVTTSRWHALAALIVAAACAVTPVSVMAQQGGTTRYVYDPNGRLRGVILPTGEAAGYEYDAAGTFTAIRRYAADALALLSFSPHEGSTGDRVSFYGFGFGTGAGENTIAFNGVNARIISASSLEIIAEVPDRATTGPVTITTPRGSITTTESFRILDRLRVNPAVATVLSGRTFQFTAVVPSRLGDQRVRWSVNGIEGGNATVGTISATGVYTAPDVQLLFVLVRATSLAVPSLVAEAQVTVRDDLFPVLSSGVTVRYGPADPLDARNALVSVRRGLIGDLGSARSEPVSVRRGFIGELGSAHSGLVSVRRGLLRDPGSTRSALVSATTGPHVSAISPNAVVRGATATVTMTGANLGGATALRFLDTNGAIDSNIVASNLSVNADGSALAATVVVGGSVPLGRRVVVVSTASGQSLSVNVNSNTFEIVAP